MTKLLFAAALQLMLSCTVSSQPRAPAAAPRASLFRPPVCSDAPPPAIEATSDSTTCDLPGSL